MGSSDSSHHKQVGTRASTLGLPLGAKPSLYSAKAVLRGEVPHGLRPLEAELFRTIARWLDDCISRPHPDLGRSGDQCPWTRRTLDLDRLFLASIPACSAAALDARMLDLQAALGSLNEVSALDTFRAIVVVFPDVVGTGEAFLLGVHRRLKPAFLNQRMMLGEFYPGCPKPGLHNPQFRPLQAPHPVLVIRPMVEQDIVFLTDQDAFVDAYLATFGARGRRHLALWVEHKGSELDETRRRALAAKADPIPAQR